jgi:hypothetical protein
LAGKPNSSTFPFTSLSFSTRDPTDPSKEVYIGLTNDELAVGLQYGPTAGFEGLIAWVYGLQEAAHGRKKGEGWNASIGAGSQDLLYKVNRSVGRRFDFSAYVYLKGRQCTSRPGRHHPRGIASLCVNYFRPIFLSLRSAEISKLAVVSYLCFRLYTVNK